LFHQHSGRYCVMTGLALLFNYFFHSSLFSQKMKLQVVESWVVELLFQTNLSNLFLLVAIIIPLIEKLCAPLKLYKS
jgi:hypothetical protein